MFESEDSPHKSGGLITLNYESKPILLKAFMPFIKNGGLFIPTEKSFEFGDELFLVLNLPEEKEQVPVSTKVVWLTPKGAQGNRVQGIGVQFRDDGMAKTKIETILGGLLKSTEPTYTM